MRARTFSVVRLLRDRVCSIACVSESTVARDASSSSFSSPCSRPSPPLTPSVNGRVPSSPCPAARGFSASASATPPPVSDPDISRQILEQQLEYAPRTTLGAGPGPSSSDSDPLGLNGRELSVQVYGYYLGHELFFEALGRSDALIMCDKRFQKNSVLVTLEAVDDLLSAVGSVGPADRDDSGGLGGIGRDAGGAAPGAFSHSTHFHSSSESWHPAQTQAMGGSSTAVSSSTAAHQALPRGFLSPGSRPGSASPYAAVAAEAAPASPSLSDLSSSAAPPASQQTRGSQTSSSSSYFQSDMESRHAFTRGAPSYLVAYRFGVVVFFNVPTREKEDLLRLASKFVGGGKAPLSSAPNVPIQDRSPDEVLTLTLRPATLAPLAASASYPQPLTPDSLVLDRLDPGAARVVATVLAQSVALEQHGREVDQILFNFSEINRFMERTGRLPPPSVFHSELEGREEGRGRLGGKGKAGVDKRELLQKVARTNLLLTDVLLKIKVLDRMPDIAWKSPMYGQVWDYLKNDLEMRERFDTLREKISLVQDDVKLLLEVLAQEKSERLEKIIIALISIEIALGVWGHVEGGKMGWVAEALGALGWDVFGFKGPGGGGGK